MGTKTIALCTEDIQKIVMVAQEAGRRGDYVMDLSIFSLGAASLGYGKILAWNFYKKNSATDNDPVPSIQFGEG